MKVMVGNKIEVDLNKNSFVSSGGEGSVYAKGNTAYKIYTDPKKMIPVDKVRDLQCLTDSNIIKPLEILYQKGTEIGYTMRYVKDAYALCQLFTKAFKQRFGIAPGKIFDLVKMLKTIVEHVHSKKVLIVDLNELNFLVSQNFEEIYAIDVDSYQTSKYRATALMESIRDRHSKSFNEGTDWFAFAIVSFQLFIGIHPYKGKHKTDMSFDDRMLKNISVLSPDVKIPVVCEDFSVIPDFYLDWYTAVLNEGKRLPAPDGIALIRLLSKKLGLQASDVVDISETYAYPENIRFINLNPEFVITDNAVYLERKMILPYTVSGSFFTLSKNKRQPYLVYIKGGLLYCFDPIHQSHQNLNISAKQIMGIEDRVYYKYEDGVFELKIQDNHKITPEIIKACNAMPNARDLYSGVFIQSLLGTFHATIFSESGMSHNVRLNDIDDCKIIDAKYLKQVLMIVVFDNQKKYYSKHIYNFSNDFGMWITRVYEDIHHHGFNFTVLDNGVTISIEEDERFNIFNNDPSSKNIKEVRDKAIDLEMKLISTGNQVMFTKGEKLCNLRMK